MKKSPKKLVLAKETLRSLEKGELGRVVGASEVRTECLCSYYSNCDYNCDMPVTTSPTCIE